MSNQQKTQVSYLNPANMFTALRIPLALLGVYLFAAEYEVLGVIIIMIASLTDMFDGQVARRFNYTSDFGALMDRTADKAMMAIVLTFAITQLSGATRLLLFGVALVELMNFGIGVYCTKKRLGIGIVGWRGRSAMFARMTSVSTLLLSFAIEGSLGSIALAIGVISGVLGIVVGLLAFVEYVGKIRQAENSDLR